MQIQAFYDKTTGTLTLKIPINVFPPKHLLTETDKKQIGANEVTELK